MTFLEDILRILKPIVAKGCEVTNFCDNVKGKMMKMAGEMSVNDTKLQTKSKQLKVHRLQLGYTSMCSRRHWNGDIP